MSNDREVSGAVSLVCKLFHLSDKIVGDRESLGAVLALVTEVEAMRGKGSQFLSDNLSQRVTALVYSIRERLPYSKIAPGCIPYEDELRELAQGTDLVECVEMLMSYFFARTQGPSARSFRMGIHRAEAWSALGEIAEFYRHPPLLAHALKVAANQRAHLRERDAAISFLPEYWGGDKPDKATVTLLEELAANPPDRDFLVTVMQARIALDLDSELGAMLAVDE